MPEGRISKSFRGAVISVGGAPDPVVFSLKQHHPECVLFLASPASAATVDQVLPALDYTPQHEIVRLRNEGDLAESYERLREAIPKWLEHRSLTPGEVYVDMTGGTKPMSAALAMVGSEYFSRFNYVAGTVRDKSGLGIVSSGTEVPLVVENPLEKLATRERERSCWLFAHYHADAAHHVLQGAADRCGANLRQRLCVFARLVHLFAEADRFQFGNLKHQFGAISAQVQLIFAHDYSTFEKIDALAEHWDNVKGESKDGGEPVSATLRELLANAERRARQERYDDAIGRLYRATELFVQGELEKAFGWRLAKIQIVLNEEVTGEARKCLQDEYARKLGLKEGFNALRYSTLPQHSEVAARYVHIESHLQKRNSSILAHGLRPATQGDFEGFWKALLPVIGVEDSDIPRWPQLEF
jgi:CRISPR-associated protein (TIGR02710 family)